MRPVLFAKTFIQRIIKATGKQTERQQYVRGSFESSSYKAACGIFSYSYQRKHKVSQLHHVVKQSLFLASCEEAMEHVTLWIHLTRAL